MNLPNYLLSFLKYFPKEFKIILLRKILDSSQVKSSVTLLADVVRCVGILSKENFDPSIGIDNIYKRGLLKSVPRLLTLASQVKDPTASKELLANVVNHDHSQNIS